MAPLLNDELYCSNNDSCIVNCSQDDAIESKNLHRQPAGAESTKTSDDAFLYYSNDALRMSALKMTYDEDCAKAGSQSSHQRIRRKTRISFELHSSLVMEDLLEDMFDGDDGLDLDLGAIECEDRNDLDCASKMDLLKELLEM